MPQPTSLSRPVVLTGLAVGAVAVSFAAILARVAMGPAPELASAAPGYAPALGIAFWRTAFGAVALAPLAWRAQRRADVRLRPSHHRLLFASGGFLAAHFALFQGALALTTVASAVTLVTASPIFVALGAWWLLGERTDRRTVLGMTLTIVGALVIGLADLTGAELGRRALIGDAMAFGGAVCITGYLLIGRRLRRDLAATTYSAFVFGWAAVLLLPLCLALGAPLTGYESLVWLAIVGIVVGPQLLGHTVFNALLSTVPPTLVAIVVLAEPVGAGVLAWLLLDELPAGWYFVGAPLVLAGIAVATARRQGRSRRLRRAGAASDAPR